MMTNITSKAELENGSLVYPFFFGGMGKRFPVNINTVESIMAKAFEFKR